MMENLNQPDWELAARYLAGETSTKEEEELLAWLEEDSARQAEFSKLAQSWVYAGEQQALRSINEDKAWVALKSRLANGQSARFSPIRQLAMHPSLKIAASLLLIIAVAFVVYLLAGKHSQTENLLSAVNNLGNPLTVNLPDGSVVTLNQGSKLEYPAQLNGSTREVSLDGEAFFQVKPDHSKPFIVHTDAARVRVVGTTFNVSAYKNSDEVRVVVESGRVELSGNKETSQLLVLEKGNYGLINRSKNLAEKGENRDVNYLSWKTRIIRFDHTPLSEVVSVLNRTYHINLLLTTPSLARLPLTDMYTDESSDTIIEVLSRVYKLEIKHTDSAIELSGK